MEIGEVMYNNYHDYDAFVIIYRIDTIAYTYTALLYIFKNLNKPIVITGAQKAIEKTIG